MPRKLLFEMQNEMVFRAQETGKKEREREKVETEREERGERDER